MIESLRSDWRFGLAAAVVLAVGFALGSAWLTPRGPMTSGQALSSMGIALAIGTGAGFAMGSRWSAVVTPAVFVAVFEIARIGVVGPTVDAIELGSFYGILAFVLGRVVHGLLVLGPMILGSLAGVWLAGRRGLATVSMGIAGGAVAGVLAVTTIALVVLIARPASTAPIVSGDGGAIAELTTVPIGGHDQAMMIRGRSAESPVLLYLTGGPGGTDLGAMRRDVGLEQSFVVVTWDQRGAGKSYAALDPTETFTLDRMISDTIEVTEYLRDRFDEDRIYLVGQSWGSTLGVLAAQQRPDLYHAFVGVGQMVSQRETDVMFWEDALAWAEETGNTELADTLRRNGPPPYDDLIRYDPVVSHEHDWNAYPGFDPDNEMPAILFVPEYTFMDRINAFRGFLDTNATLYPQLQDIDFRGDVTSLDVPVYMVLGEHEARGRAVLAEEWFGRLEAPIKVREVFEGGGHRAHFDRPALFTDLMERVLERADEPPVAPILEDGEHFAFVSSASTGEMTLDPAEFLIGAEAEAAAREDGVIGADEELPNGFHVRNAELEQVEVAISDGFEATLLDGATVQPGPPLDAATLAALFAGDADPSGYYGFVPDGLPMTVTVDGGSIVSARQFYLP